MATATKRKRKPAKKRTTNNNIYLAVELPFADSKTYAVVKESIRSDLCPSGYDWQYGVVNKATGVLEMRASTLPLAVLVMQSLEKQLANVTTGELNGYGPLPASPKVVPDGGDIPLLP